MFDVKISEAEAANAVDHFASLAHQQKLLTRMQNAAHAMYLEVLVGTARSIAVTAGAKDVHTIIPQLQREYGISDKSNLSALSFAAHFHCGKDTQYAQVQCGRLCVLQDKQRACGRIRTVHKWDCRASDGYSFLSSSHFFCFFRAAFICGAAYIDSTHRLHVL